MTTLLYWAGCRGLGALYCILVITASSAGLAYAAGLDWGLTAAPLLAASVNVLTSTGNGAATVAWLLASTLAAAYGTSCGAPTLAGLALAAASAALWAASRKPGLAYAGLAAGSTGEPLPAAVAIVVASAGVAHFTKRLHASLALLPLALLVYYSTPATAAMVTSSLALSLVMASGGPAGLRSCPFRTDVILGLPALVVTGAGVALEIAGYHYWASLIWPTGFILQASSILAPEPALGSPSLRPDGGERSGGS